MCKQKPQSPPTQSRFLSYPSVIDTSTLPQLWSCVEVSSGVISACLPSLITLFLVLLGKRPSSFRHHSVSFRRHRDGKIRNAEFSRMADATDGDACSQSLELASGIRRDPNNLTNLAEIWGSILVTVEVDQVSERIDQVPRPAEDRTVPGDLTLSVEC